MFFIEVYDEFEGIYQEKDWFWKNFIHYVFSNI